MSEGESTPQPTGSAVAYPWFLASVGSWALAAGLQQVLFAWLLVGELHESGGRVGASWRLCGTSCAPDPVCEYPISAPPHSSSSPQQRGSR